MLSVLAHRTLGAAACALTLASCSRPPPAPSAASPGIKPEPALQTAAERAVKEAARPAAVVALDPRTGAVRAFHSVAGDRGDPLLTADHPASTFKAFAAIAGLEAGVLTESTTLDCGGTFQFAGKEFTCNKPHGHETTSQSISRSCNTFYYRMATQMDHALTLDVARRFGFGARTGVQLADEPGVVPDAARARAVKADPESAVPLLDAIGHGEIKVTLLQLARAFSVIANGGKLVRLSLSGDGGVERTVSLAPEHLALVRHALANAVEQPDGTAHDVATPGFAFAGKTGGASSPPLAGHGEETDLVFVAYAPPENATLLVAARVERSDDTLRAKRAVKAVLDAWRATNP